MTKRVTIWCLKQRFCSTQAGLYDVSPGSQQLPILLAVSHKDMPSCIIYDDVKSWEGFLEYSNDKDGVWLNIPISRVRFSYCETPFHI
ncbi:hypothetical protein KDA_50270 [Dictyobacter alpinus]|uniref:Uncharacterized protein n=1 Tax=Dictyobacter alpinus TaxID=2014873 RepID=A0A402BDS4_9CHLR|nr:hypothetical protein KDA_50270 [Dictyobacter alpinus]